jgi:hypothetical protein
MPFESKLEQSAEKSPWRSAAVKTVIGGGSDEPLTLVVAEEEELVLYDRPAECAAEHVPAQLRPARPREVVVP